MTFELPFFFLGVRVVFFFEDCFTDFADDSFDMLEG